jgi:hypothetical protein
MRERRGRTLANVAVLEGVDALGRLLDLATDDLGNELVNELLEVARASLTLHDPSRWNKTRQYEKRRKRIGKEKAKEGDALEHLLADLADLGGLSVGGLLHLVGALLGEANGEEADEVAVGGLDVELSLDAVDRE